MLYLGPVSYARVLHTSEEEQLYSDETKRLCEPAGGNFFSFFSLSLSLSLSLSFSSRGRKQSFMAWLVLSSLFEVGRAGKGGDAHSPARPFVRLNARRVDACLGTKGLASSRNTFHRQVNTRDTTSRHPRFSANCIIWRNISHEQSHILPVEFARLAVYSLLRISRLSSLFAKLCYSSFR